MQIINTYIRKIKLVTKGYIAFLFFKVMGKKFNQQQTITIFGAPRSGSTWLAELLSSCPEHLQIFEPLHPENVRQVKQVIPTRNHYISAEQPWDDGKKLFTKILTGKLLNPWILSQAKLLKIFQSKRLVIKFVRANLMLDWFTQNLNVLPPVLIVRHPCAVIASQLKKGWPPSKIQLLNHPYLEQYPSIKSKCLGLSTSEELAALAWCLRYHAPLSASKPYKFILVTYEELVLNGDLVLKNIFKKLQLTYSDQIARQLIKPSDTSTEKEKINQRDHILTSWQQTLTADQIDNILSVVNIFNMAFYNKNIEADYQLLKNFNG